MESEKQPKITLFKDGDEIKISILFKKVFLKTLSKENWEWKFKNNPYLAPQAVVASVEDDEIVAHYTVVPVRINVMGKPRLSAQSVDTMVDPKFRGQQLFEKTAKECFNKIEEQGALLVYGFPNDNSYPGFLRKLGWSRVGYLNHYLFRTGIKDLLLSLKNVPLLSNSICSGVLSFLFKHFTKIKLELSKKILMIRTKRYFHCKIEDTLPEDAQSLWRSIASYFVFSIDKDQKYLAWRYGAHPEMKFNYVSLRKESELYGLIIACTKDQKTLLICELMVKNRDILASKLLLNQVILKAINEDYDKIEFIGRDAGFFDSAFSSFVKETNFGLVFCLKALREEEGLLRLLDNPENWSITLGDTDVI